ncbi:ATP-dependent DNA helicase II subunit 2 [Trametes pubescens]|uniref:ATP-dependent DNA helicase II subunit 2 n=1 Tax=Trametes pubescens TaxID=154538 RepID=A0A1M2VBA4_TRAPU|nr:ATP-dependent DNA helicase II subunit 2 [Trametes pubescens]
MGKTRQVSVSGADGKDSETIEMTNLEWSLQYVMLKIQEMIFNGRKTDKCGVILFGSEETKNIINEENGGYEHVSDYIPIAHPNAATLAKLQALEPSTVSGDPIDALIVAIETQDRELATKKTWTRKICILTDGENPIEVEDWEATANKMNALNIQFTVVGVDFDDDDFQQEDKSKMKRANEEFYRQFTEHLESGVVGNCDYVLTEVSRPDVKEVRSTMTGNVLRIGDTDVRPHEALELMVKTSKCTALSRPKSFKKFARRKQTDEEKAAAKDRMDEDGEEEESHFAQLHMRSEYYLEEEKPGSTKREGSADGDADDAEAQAERDKRLIKVQKEELVRGYKYGASFAPAPEEGFPKFPVRAGMDICGFFPQERFRREMAMGEVYYVWADPASPMQQVALSSIVHAMNETQVVAITRWVKTEKGEPKMGVLWPTVFEEIDCFLWVQMPFADDIRNFTFASLENLVTKKGEVVKEHPYLPTNEQMDTMEKFVDAMDLMDAGEKDEDGNRLPWFDTTLSYNPAIHRMKQAQFHAAIVKDLNTHPLPPPHEELLKYFEPPRRVLKRAREAIEECKSTFNVREVPKKVARVRKDEHVRAPDEDEEMLLLDRQAGPSQTQAQRATQSRSFAQTQTQQASPSRTQQQKKPAGNDSDSVTEIEDDEDEDDELLLDTAARRPERAAPLPTPARSLSPDPRVDRNRPKGRIVGYTYPLADFRKNIERGDVVTKAVEDLAYIVKEVVVRPFASKRFDEMLECMHELRKVSLEEDEIDAWNTFIRELKDTCLKSKPGNKVFWDKVRGIGRPLSYISESEATKAGGKSAISESEAQQSQIIWMHLDDL